MKKIVLSIFGITSALFFIMNRMQTSTQTNTNSGVTLNTTQNPSITTKTPYQAPVQKSATKPRSTTSTRTS